MSDNSWPQLMFSFFIVPTLNKLILSYFISSHFISFYLILSSAKYIYVYLSMMKSPNGNIFRVTVPLWPVDSPQKRQRRGALMFFMMRVWRNGWANSLNAGAFRRHIAHCDVTAMRFSMKRISIWAPMLITGSGVPRVTGDMFLWEDNS